MIWVEVMSVFFVVLLWIYPGLVGFRIGLVEDAFPETFVLSNNLLSFDSAEGPSNLDLQVKTFRKTRWWLHKHFC